MRASSGGRGVGGGGVWGEGKERGPGSCGGRECAVFGQMVQNAREVCDTGGRSG